MTRRLAPTAVLMTVLLSAAPGRAVIQGMTGGGARANTLESAGDPASAAAWRQVDVSTLQDLSRPMYGEILRFQRRWEDAATVRSTEERYQTEVTESLAREGRLLEADRRAAARRPLTAGARQALRQETDDYLLRWMVLYPDRIFRYGLYRQMAGREDQLVRDGKTASAVELEAEARECCARQFRQITCRYLDRLARRARLEGASVFASRCELLSRHYQRLAAGQVAEARAIRQHREEVGWFLAEARSQGWESTDRLLRRIVDLRLAVLARKGAIWEELKHSDSSFLRQELSQLARLRDAGGLFLSSQSADPVIRQAAQASLDQAIRRGDSLAIKGLVDTLPQLGHEDVLRLHRTLSVYSAPRDFPASFPEARDQEARDYWRRWWAGRLAPGLESIRFEDTECRVPVSESAGRCRSVRQEGVLQATVGGVYLVTLPLQASVRLLLDGQRLAVTADRTAGVQAARLLLEEGEHVLQAEYVSARGITGSPRLQILQVTASGRTDGVRVLHFRSPRQGEWPDGSPAAAVVDERFFTYAPGVLLLICAVLLVVGCERGWLGWIGGLAKGRLPGVLRPAAVGRSHRFNGPTGA